MLENIQEYALQWTVSIRARPFGRAMRRCVRRNPGGYKGFNPRPTIRPGDAPGSIRPYSSMTMFQSAPDHSAGRCFDRLIRPSHHLGFNPRPTIRPGDAQQLRPEHVKKDVSIRARPFGRAMPSSFSTSDSSLKFQSAPDHSAGRCNGYWLLHSCYKCFNPRPTIRPGDA